MQKTWRISTYFKLNPQKFSPAAAKSPISVYFQVVLLISEFLRELIFCTIFSHYFRVSSRTIFSLYFRVSSRTKIMRIRTKLGNIACGGLEDNNIIAPVLQMSCSTWTLVSVRLRIVEVHSHVNQNRKLGNTSGSALSQFEHRSKTH